MNTAPETLAGNATINARIVAELAADPNAVSAEVAAAALAQHAKEKAEAQQRTMVDRLSTVEANTSEAVQHLRECRKKEARAKAYLTALADAEAKYKTDGNWEAYQQTRREARNKLQSCE